MMTHAEPLRFSASRIATWMTCPLQAKFQYLDGLPRRQSAAATFGKAVHAALEHYNINGNDVGGALAIFRDQWHNPEKYGMEPEEWPKGKSFGGYLNSGLEAIRDYHDQMRWQTTRQVIATEHPFLVPFGEFELHGYVDLVEITKTKRGQHVVKITDFKTNGRAPFIGNLRLNIQFTVYDYASRQPEFWLGNERDPVAFPPLTIPDELFSTPDDAWARAQDLGRQNIWYGLMQKREYDAGERDLYDYQRLYRVCHEIRKALDNDVYVPNISGDSCTFCPFKVPCGLPIDPREYEANVA